MTKTIIKCPKCGAKSNQVVFDYKYGIYKCTKCCKVYA